MRKPAFILGGTHSGCGKTTVSLGIMAALKARGMQVQPFKCGPDFIDPTLHQLITGQVSRNLDIRMCGPEWVQGTFLRNLENKDCGVIEGVMGLFDGGAGSAATLAKTLEIPAFLIIDVRAAAESIAAVVQGFATLDPQVNLAGVLCNRIGSLRHKELIVEAVTRYTDVPVIGCIPRNEEVTIPSRHLGLYMGEEKPLQGADIAALAELMEQHLDLDAMLRTAYITMRTEVPNVIAPYPAIAPGTQKVRIGVARDQAFCFYYQDNLDLLTAAGAELITFSPLQDDKLPPSLDGLYLGGGYPELFAEQLSANTSMRKEIFDFCQADKPVYAECGGFMYLTRELKDLEGHTFPMAAVFPFSSHMQKRLRRLGYREPRVARNTVLAPAGVTLSGHEFHYSTITREEQDTTPSAYLLPDGQKEGYLHKQTLAGYIHLHWGRTPEAAMHFVQACKTTKGNEKT